MPYTLPQFNVFADVWDIPNVPADGDPDRENVPCQFYLVSRCHQDLDPQLLELWVPPIHIRLPIEENAAWVAAKVFECPPESGRYFIARFKEIMHFGFPNEYRLCIVSQCDENGDGIRRFVDGGGPAPPAVHHAEGAAFVSVTAIADGIASNSGFVPPDTHHASGSVVVEVEKIASGSATNTP